MKEQIKNILQNWSFDEGLALFEKISRNHSVKAWIARKGEAKATEKLKYELEKLLDTPQIVKKIAFEIVENENLEEVKEKIKADEDLLSDIEFPEDEYYKDLVQEQNSAFNQELKLRNQNADFINKSDKEREQHAQAVLAQREKRINLSQRITIYKQTGQQTNDDMSKAISSYSVAEAQKTLTNSLRPKLSRRRSDLKKKISDTRRQEIETEILILEAEEKLLKKIIEEGE
jgi:hypothetical protein